MRTVCEKDMCAGCMACVDSCAHKAIAIQDGISSYNAVIDESKCVGCGLCEHVCQQLHPASLREPIAWKQGWAIDAKERTSSSSGGAAAVLSRAFVQRGGVVCSCAFRNGRFGFEVAEHENELGKFRGSKYVKSDPTGAYRSVLALLHEGREVLFIGLPCQVSAMRNYCRDHELLYTIDLICHGTPSPQILERFLAEKNFDLQHVKDISFRRKTRFAVSIDGRTVDAPGVTDRYSIAFLSGLDYTENCYSCRYACRERVSDLTLGDSWGTVLSDEVGLGVSLVLCQTSKGQQLLDFSKMELRNVDVNRAIENNAQLERPSASPSQRETFLRRMAGRKSVDSAVFLAFPQQCIKQLVKWALIKLRIWEPRESVSNGS